MPPSVPPISAQEEEFFLFALDIVKEAGVVCDFKKKYIFLSK
jgi:hypothetical protein